MNITCSFYFDNSQHWLCNDDGKIAGMFMYTGLTRQLRPTKAHTLSK